MAGENLKRVVVSVQDYKKHGYSNTVHTDKGMTVVIEDYQEFYIDNSKNYEKIIFKNVIGKDFGNKTLMLKPTSYLFLEIIIALKEKIQDLLKHQRTEPNPETRYNDVLHFLEKKYFINRRDDNDSNLESLIYFYNNLKKFYDYGYPLYLTPATEKDIKEHWGNFKAGDNYEPIFPQKIT